MEIDIIGFSYENLRHVPTNMKLTLYRINEDTLINGKGKIIDGSLAHESMLEQGNRNSSGKFRITRCDNGKRLSFIYENNIELITDITYEDA